MHYLHTLSPIILQGIEPKQTTMLRTTTIHPTTKMQSRFIKPLSQPCMHVIIPYAQIKLAWQHRATPNPKTYLDSLKPEHITIHSLGTTFTAPDQFSFIRSRLQTPAKIQTVGPLYQNTYSQAPSFMPPHRTKGNQALIELNACTYCPIP